MIPGRWFWPAFGLMVLLQLALPGRMILQHEQTLRQGAEHRFKTAPVDPYDAFRGRYVALGFPDTQARPSAELAALDEAERQRLDTLYATVERGDDGFSSLGQLLLAPPAQGDYLRLPADRVSLMPGDGPARVDLPFDRYYLTEGLAPEAERLYRERRSADAEAGQAWLLVRLRAGRAVPAGLYIDDRRIEDLARTPGD